MTLEIQADTHELPRMSEVTVLLQVKIRLQASNERIAQSSVAIVRASDRLERSAERLLRSQSICVEGRLCASTPSSN